MPAFHNSLYVILKLSLHLFGTQIQYDSVVNETVLHIFINNRLFPVKAKYFKTGVEFHGIRVHL